MREGVLYLPPFRQGINLPPPTADGILPDAQYPIEITALKSPAAGLLVCKRSRKEKIVKIKLDCCFPLILVFCAINAAQPAVAQADLACSGLTHTLSVNWPLFGFTSCNARFNPNEFVLSPTTVQNLQVKWHYSQTIQGMSSPAVVNGTLYVGTYDADGHGYLSAFNAKTGALLWNYPTGSVVWSSPAVANGRVFIGGGDNNVYAVDARTGVLVWKYTTGGQVWGSPTVAGGIVYVGSFDSEMYALDAAAGVRLWAHFAGQFPLGTPAVAGGLVYIPADYPHNDLYAVDAKTGVERWSYTTKDYLTTASPAVANGVVYVGSNDGTLYALTASTGVLRWTASAQGTYIHAVAVANGLVYAGSSDSYLYCFNANSGALVWRYPTGGQSGLYSSPAVANGVVYIEGGDGSLDALDASTGTLLWQYGGADSGGASPTIVNGILYAGGEFGPYAFALPVQQ